MLALGTKMVPISSQSAQPTDSFRHAHTYLRWWLPTKIISV